MTVGGGETRLSDGGPIDPDALAEHRLDQRLAQDSQGVAEVFRLTWRVWLSSALARKPFGPRLAQDLGANGVGDLRHQGRTFQDKGHDVSRETLAQRGVRHKSNAFSRR